MQTPRRRFPFRERSPVAAGVALTFDDGPHPEGTPAVLDVLAAAGARATFFVIGEQVERRPELLARILAEGHAVALHGYRHRLQLRLTPQGVADDIRRGVAVVAEDASGLAPVWHRPPFGIYSPAGLRAAREDGALAPALVTLGQGLAQVHDARANRPPGHPRSHRRRRDPPARCGFLQRPSTPTGTTVAALGSMLAELKRRKLDTVLPV